MSIMLNESNSSFDTTPSFDFVMRHEGGRDRDDDVSDEDDEDEGYDVIEGENDHRGDIGVLIVPPTTGSSENSRNTVLSIPDSVPTVLNSSMLDLPDCVHVVDNTQATPVRSNSFQVGANEGHDPELFSYGSKIDEIAAGQNTSTWRRNMLALLLFAAVSTGSVCHAFYLHRESLLLKEQVRLLTDEAARSAAKLDELKQKQARDFALDNCWLQAYAEMSLGQCAQGASETVKETVNTFGTSVHIFWDRMKQAYQENVKETMKDWEGFYRSDSTKTTANFFTRMNDVWKQSWESKVSYMTEPLNMMSSRFHDFWNRSKENFYAFNKSEPVNKFGSNVYKIWVDRLGVNKTKVEDQVYGVGQSLFEASSTFTDVLKRGYNDLKDSVKDGIFYKKSDAADSNMTSADVTETDSPPGNCVQSANESPSISKKVLVAAAWSAGAAILVSTFEMYWNQHGNFLALEN